MKKNNTYKSLAMTMYTIAAIILAVGFATVVFASAEEQETTETVEVTPETQENTKMNAVETENTEES